MIFGDRFEFLVGDSCVAYALYVEKWCFNRLTTVKSIVPCSVKPCRSLSDLILELMLLGMHFYRLFDELMHRQNS